jgi:hypothetical protein
MESPVGWQNTFMISSLSTKAKRIFRDKLAYAIARGEDVDDA